MTQLFPNTGLASIFPMCSPATYLPTGMCFNGAFDTATLDTQDYSDPGPKSGLSGVSS